MFVSHAKENADCAEQIRGHLEGLGYTVWREPSYPHPQSASYPAMIEAALLGSAALVLVWSSRSVSDAWVQRQRLFAERLQKPIFPVLLDEPPLPQTLANSSSLANQSPCANVVTQLVALPGFPSTQSNPFLSIFEQAAHEHIYRRKEAISEAVKMLQHDDHREALLALLEYLAVSDPMMGVRDKAQEALDAEKRRTDAAASPPPLFSPADAQYIFGVRCKQGHVSYFNKRDECQKHRGVQRVQKTEGGKVLDELVLKCQTPSCGETVVAYIDCGGLK